MLRRGIRAQQTTEFSGMFQVFLEIISLLIFFFPSPVETPIACLTMQRNGLR